MALGKNEKVLLGVLAGLGLAAGVYFAYNWYARTHAALIGQRDALASELNQVKEKVRNLAVTEERLKEARELQVSLERKVPTDEEVPQLLRDIAGMLTVAGVDLGSFRPGRPVPSVLPEWNEIKVSISVTGTYSKLMAMFDRLRTARRLIGVTSCSFSSGGSEANPVLTCSVSLSVYFTKKS